MRFSEGEHRQVGVSRFGGVGYEKPGQSRLASREARLYAQSVVAEQVRRQQRRERLTPDRYLRSLLAPAGNGGGGSWTGALEIEPDGEELPIICSALWLGVGGAIHLMTGGGDEVTLMNVPDNYILPLTVSRVFGDTTTCSNIVGLYNGGAANGGTSATSAAFPRPVPPPVPRHGRLVSVSPGHALFD